MNLICGTAPDDLPDTMFDKIFIGGASKVLPQTIEYISRHLKENGTLVANFILTSSLETFLKELKMQGFVNIQAGLRQTANMSEHGIWKGENPIYIVQAWRLA